MKRAGLVRPMGTAFIVFFPVPGLRQHRISDADVVGLAIVRGASERNLLVIEAKAIGGAALDDRQTLKRLDRRTRKNRPADIAGRCQDFSVVAQDGISARMAAFDEA